MVQVFIIDYMADMVVPTDAILFQLILSKSQCPSVLIIHAPGLMYLVTPMEIS